MREEEDSLEVNLESTFEQANELLHKLAHDDGFRAELEQNPGEVLRRYGVHVSPAPPAAKLPSKRELAGVLEEFGEHRDLFGRVDEWRYKLLGVIACFPAMPLLDADPPRDDAT
jgi:putative modified peptide